MTLVAALALAAALLTAVATIFARQGLRRSDPYTGAWINMIVGAIGLWICVLVTEGVGEVSPRSLLLFAAAGLIGTVGGRLTRFLSIDKVGAAVTAAVSSLTPLIASLLAILLLGERVTLPIVVGTVVITRAALDERRAPRLSPVADRAAAHFRNVLRDRPDHQEDWT